MPRLMLRRRRGQSILIKIAGVRVTVLHSGSPAAGRSACWSKLHGRSSTWGTSWATGGTAMTSPLATRLPRSPRRHLPERFGEAMSPQGGIAMTRTSRTIVLGERRVFVELLQDGSATATVLPADSDPRERARASFKEFAAFCRSNPGVYPAFVDLSRKRRRQPPGPRARGGRWIPQLRSQAILREVRSLRLHRRGAGTLRDAYACMFARLAALEHEDLRETFATGLSWVDDVVSEDDLRDLISEFRRS